MTQPFTPGPHMMAIPGPSVMPMRVLAAMQRPAPNIYFGALHDMVDGLFPDLRAVARTQHKLAIYIANGHGMWEATVANIVNPGDRVLVIETGRFGQNWGGQVRRMGIETTCLDFGNQTPANPARITEALRADPNIRAVLTVQADTATGVLNDISAIRAAIDAADHPALLVVDCMASLACDEFRMDEWGVDVMMAGSQKGLMTPPGLGFAWFSPKAAIARERCSPTDYWDWTTRANAEYFYEKFNGTAPTHLLYALREALDMLVHEEGVDRAIARHEMTARAIWAAIDAWGREGGMRCNIADPAQRSRAVTAIVLPGNATRLRDWCENAAGLTLGIGLGFDDTDNRFRLGHMGQHNAPMILGVLATMDAGMKALDVPHGSGALEAAARVFADGLERTA